MSDNLLALNKFKFCSVPPTLLIWLNVWDLMCHFSNDIVNLNLSSIGTLVPVAPCGVFHATRNQIYWRFDMDNMVFTGTLILYHTHNKLT